MLRSPNIEVLSFITRCLRSVSVAVSVIFVVNVFLHHPEDEAGHRERIGLETDGGGVPLLPDLDPLGRETGHGADGCGRSHEIGDGLIHKPATWACAPLFLCAKALRRLPGRPDLTRTSSDPGAARLGRSREPSSSGPRPS